MKNVLAAISAAAAFSLSACATTGGTERASTPAASQQFADSHPVAMYQHAAELFGDGKKDEAVFWFYAGQLRYRIHLAARPNLPPDQDAAVMSSLNYSLGTVINEYAGGNPDEWAATIADVLEWDASTPNEFTPKADFPEAHNAIRDGLSSMRERITENKEKIRSERAARGLENRV